MLSNFILQIKWKRQTSVSDWEMTQKGVFPNIKNTENWSVLQ